MSATNTIDRAGATVDALRSKSAILGWIQDEHQRRRKTGETLDMEGLCRRFPDFDPQIRQLLEVCELVESHSHLISVAHPPRPITWPEPGEEVLGYRLAQRLGTGTFARVFLANEMELGHRLVVVKFSLLGATEADLLGKLGHANIVPVYSMKEASGSPFTVICMPYLGSATLEHVQAQLVPRPKRGRVILQAITATTVEPPPAVTEEPSAALRYGTYTEGIVSLGLQLAEALAFVHAQGVCHRDLKPSNVLLGLAGRPMLLDFNLSEEQRATNVPAGGTPGYMPPEQQEAMATPGASCPPDPRSDVYSLGVMLYELLAGEHPFRASGGKHLPGRAAALRKANPDVDGRLARLIECCLAFEASDRPTATELAGGLQRYLSPWPRRRRWLARHSWAVALAACLVLATGVAGAVAWANRPTPRESAWSQGQAAYQRGDYRAAVQHFSQVLEAEPNSAEALFARARAFQQLGEFSVALADYETADRTSPDGRTRACAGYCKSRLGQHGGAVTYYENAIKAGFKPAEVYNDLGHSRLRQSGLKNRIQAKRDLDRAISIQPRLQAAYLNRARFHLLRALEPVQPADHVLKEVKEGVKDIEQAKKLAPPTAELFIDAANLCAVAAEQDIQWNDETLMYLEQAVAHGYSPRSLAEDAQADGSPLVGLSTHPRFQRLVRRPEPPSRPSVAVLVVDPIKDISP
jgi:tetratricopeptide (TPR) repeat protein